MTEREAFLVIQGFDMPHHQLETIAPRHGAKTAIAVTLLILTLFGIAGAAWELSLDHQLSGWAVVILSLFSVTTLSDRAVYIWENHLSKRESDLLEDQLNRIPKLLAGSQDIITFSMTEAMEYTIAVSPLAKTVKNTVFRYAERPQMSFKVGDKNLHHFWVDAKRSSIENGNTWHEVVSNHIGAKDEQLDFMNWATSNKSSQYFHFFINDEVYKPINLTIMDFGPNNKEVIFGWFTPAGSSGYTFLSRNTLLVAYFEQYFHYLERLKQS